MAVTENSSHNPQDGHDLGDISPEDLAAIRLHVQKFNVGGHGGDNIRAAGHLTLTMAGCMIIPLVLYTRTPWVLVLPLTVLHGLFVMKAFIVFHDAGHNSLFTTRRMNEASHLLMSWMCLTPPFWAKTHTVHHANSGNMDQDEYHWNETIFHTVREYNAMPYLERAAYRVLRDPSCFFLLAAGYKWMVYYRVPFSFVNKEYPTSELFVNGCAFVLWIWYMASLHTLYALWLMISWISGAAFGVLLFHGQHSYNPPTGNQAYVIEKADVWKHSDAAMKGSSLIWIPPLLRWFTMGIEYHHVHHLSTRIPGYRLQECHDSAPAELMKGVVRLGPRDLWKSWQNVLFDEDKRVFVSFGDLAQGATSQ
jgi:omega-6 fatty acid desaturase (delta-12 desaturase)